MVISAGPLTRVFTGVASRLDVHAVYLDTQKNLSVFAPRLPCFCGIAHIGYYTPVLRRTSSYFVSEKLFLSLSLSSLLRLLYVFAKKEGKKKEGGEKRKKNVSEEHLFTYHLGGTSERKRAIIRLHSHGFHGN